MTEQTQKEKLEAMVKKKKEIQEASYYNTDQRTAKNKMVKSKRRNSVKSTQK